MSEDATADSDPTVRDSADVPTAPTSAKEGTAGVPIARTPTPEGPLPLRMLHDRVLVSAEEEKGERRSEGGILIPATVQVARHLAWAKVVAIGPSVRSVKVGERVLFDPEVRAEVEVRNKTYLLLRERDIHAVAAEPAPDGDTGLYL